MKNNVVSMKYFFISFAKSKDKLFNIKKTQGTQL